VAKWLVRTFTTDAGGKPVDDWVRSLDPESRSAIGAAVRLLRLQGPEITMPASRYMGAGIWELRARDAKGNYRVIYFHWKGRTFGLLHGFTKKTEATPLRDLALAKSRRDTWLARASKKGRRTDG
jgi:phage-related protein